MANEDDVMEAMRKAGVTPGDYYLPYGGGPTEMNTPDRDPTGPIDEHPR